MQTLKEKQKTLKEKREENKENGRSETDLKFLAMWKNVASHRFSGYTNRIQQWKSN